MFKHMVEMHDNEQMGDIKFGIKVIKYAKSAFETQREQPWQGPPS